MRDLTEAQYRKKLRAHGISERPEFMGYHKKGPTSVSVWNAPDQSRRGRLAYLLQRFKALETP